MKLTSAERSQKKRRSDAAASVSRKNRMVAAEKLNSQYTILLENLQKDVVELEANFCCVKALHHTLQVENNRLSNSVLQLEAAAAAAAAGASNSTERSRKRRTLGAVTITIQENTIMVVEKLNSEQENEVKELQKRFADVEGNYEIYLDLHQALQVENDRLSNSVLRLEAAAGGGGAGGGGAASASDSDSGGVQESFFDDEEEPKEAPKKEATPKASPQKAPAKPAESSDDSSEDDDKSSEEREKQAAKLKVPSPKAAAVEEPSTKTSGAAKRKERQLKMQAEAAAGEAAPKKAATPKASPKAAPKAATPKASPKAAPAQVEEPKAEATAGDAVDLDLDAGEAPDVCSQAAGSMQAAAGSPTKRGPPATEDQVEKAVPPQGFPSAERGFGGGEMTYGYCKAVGHNRRTCPKKKADEAQPIIGFPNIRGNSCYQNAVLQLVPILASLCQHLRLNMTMATEGSVTLALRGILLLELTSSPKTRRTALQTLRIALSQVDGLQKYNENHQQDAGEYYIHLTDILASELSLDLGVATKPSIQGFTDLHTLKCINGVEASTTTCSACLVSSTVLNDISTISLHVPECSSSEVWIQALFEEYTKTEMMNDRLESCGCTVDNFRKRIAFKETPQYMTVRLKREKFIPGGSPPEKIMTKVHFGMNLDMSPYMVGGDQLVCKYKLVGVILHTGTFARSGHYITQTLHRKADNVTGWIECDDYDLKEITSPETGCNETAYMLMYARDDVYEEDALRTHNTNVQAKGAKEAKEATTRKAKEEKAAREEATATEEANAREAKKGEKEAAAEAAEKGKASPPLKRKDRSSHANTPGASPGHVPKRAKESKTLGERDERERGETQEKRRGRSPSLNPQGRDRDRDDASSAARPLMNDDRGRHRMRQPSRMVASTTAVNDSAPVRDNISQMTVKRLRQELIKRGLRTNGLKKSALVKRLQQAISEGNTPPTRDEDDGGGNTVPESSFDASLNEDSLLDGGSQGNQRAAEEEEEEEDEEQMRAYMLMEAEAIEELQEENEDEDEVEDEEEDEAAAAWLCTDQLTAAEEKQVQTGMFGPGSDDEKVVEYKEGRVSVDIKREGLRCLQDGEWLNDEVIEVYSRLIVKRSRDHTDEPRKLCRLEIVKNTFFYEKLTETGYDYSKVKSWTIKKPLLDTDKILVPINKNKKHWVLGCINIRDKRFEFYDSMNGSGEKVFVNLRRWLQDEWQDKKKQAIDLEGWTNFTANGCLEQRNGFDCGVFVLKFADALGRDLDLDNQPDWQQHMSLFRKRIALECLQGSLGLKAI